MRRERRPHALAVSAVCALVTLVSLAVLLPATGQAAGTLAVPSKCFVETKAGADPRTLLLGEVPTVTLRVWAICAGEIRPLHVSLVLDASQRMAGDRLRRTRDATEELVKRFRLADNPHTLVGLVTFSTTATELAELTNSEARILSGLARISASGGTAIGKGLDGGRAQLVRARRPDVQEDEVLVLFSQGTNDAGCRVAQTAANRIRTRGILLATVCVGPDCDARCMRSLATSSRYAFELERSEDLFAVFERIRKDVQNIVIKRLTIEERLAPGVRYVAASAVPTPTLRVPDGSALAWETHYVPVSGITVTYRARPIAPGDQAISLGARLHFVDNLNRIGDAAFDIPRVSVLRPEIVPSPTPP